MSNPIEELQQVLARVYSDTKLNPQQLVELMLKQATAEPGISAPVTPLLSQANAPVRTFKARVVRKPTMRVRMRDSDAVLTINRDAFNSETMTDANVSPEQEPVAQQEARKPTGFKGKKDR